MTTAQEPWDWPGVREKIPTRGGNKNKRGVEGIQGSGATWGAAAPIRPPGRGLGPGNAERRRGRAH